jgi:hypothetical protein
MELSNDISALKDLVMALLARVEALESENAGLWAENADLRLEIADLRSRLKLNSRKSHKPPSSDGLSKKPGLPKGPPKKSGGQFGQKRCPAKTMVARSVSGWCLQSGYS